MLAEFSLLPSETLLWKIYSMAPLISSHLLPHRKPCSKTISGSIRACLPWHLTDMLPHTICERHQGCVHGVYFKERFNNFASVLLFAYLSVCLCSVASNSCALLLHEKISKHFMYLLSNGQATSLTSRARGERKLHLDEREGKASTAGPISCNHIKEKQFRNPIFITLR